MSAKRILIVGPTASYKPSYGLWLTSRSGLMFYGFAQRLANGFVRNGHFVLTMDDRDSRKHMLGVRAAGAWLANRRLVHVASEFRPDLICLQHCDLISADTIHRIKEMVPHCRVAVVHYDNVFCQDSATRFRRFLEVADFAFATTAGSTLAQFAESCPVAFVPNPVDTSIDNLSAFAVPRKSVDIFCACGVSGEASRWNLIDDLRRLKPNLRYALYGRDKKNRIFGDAYYQAINRSKIGLNLNREEGNLYASDRMAQYLGNGLLLATSRRSGYQSYFDDDEMIFFHDTAELADKIEWAIADDRRWRTMAEKARAKSAAMMGGERVTDFIMRMTLGGEMPKGWHFPRQIYARPTRKALLIRPALSEPSTGLVQQHS